VKPPVKLGFMGLGCGCSGQVKVTRPVAPRPRYEVFVLQSAAPTPEIPASNNILAYKAATASRNR